MFDLEAAIREWKRRLASNPGLEDGQRAELEACLRDEVADLVRRGLSAEEAFSQVVETMGGADEIGGEFFKVYAKNRLARPSWTRTGLSLGLVWNYLVVALRNIRRQKGYSVITIAGLAVGLACAILIALWIDDELRFDRFHARADRLFRVVTEQRETGMFDHYAVTPRALGRTLKEEWPEVVHASRFMDTEFRFLHEESAVAESGAYVDPDFLRMFSFPLLQGDPRSALDEPLSIVLTESLARKYFRDEDPLGRSLTTASRTGLRVTGVIRDVPRRSHLRFGYLVPFRQFEDRLPEENRWNDVSYHTYIELSDRKALSGLEPKITALVRSHKPGAAKTEYHLQPLRRVHLHSSFKFDLPGHGDIAQVILFGAVAVFVLTIAGLNFVNLSTARSSSRAKEVGVRKVVGAGRCELIRQFIGESVLLTSLALLFALLLVKTILPSFAAFAGKAISLGPNLGAPFWAGLLAAVILVGLASGLYPAVLLAAYPAASTLKGGPRKAAGRGRLRRVLVVLQFTISVFLIICTFIVSRQIAYLRSRPLGYEPDHLLAIRLEGGISRMPQAAKMEFLRDPRVLGASLLDILPIHEGSGTNDGIWEGKPEDLKHQMRIGFVDESYLDTFRIPIAAGRFFNPLAQDGSQDAVEEIVLNESAVRAMGLEDPVGKRFSREEGRPGRIVGVVKDHQLRSAHYPIEPLILAHDPGRFRRICLRIDSEDVPGTLAALEATWKTFSPEIPFSAIFLNGAIDELYRGEMRFRTLSGAMSAVAIVIACLGMFGLVSYLAEQRAKEIGIRKVLGASAPKLFLLVSMEFFQCVGIANLLAWPLALVFMRSWLRSFAHRVPLGLDAFLLPAGLAVGIAMLTVGGQAFSASRADPVRNLRYE